MRTRCAEFIFLGVLFQRYAKGQPNSFMIHIHTAQRTIFFLFLCFRCTKHAVMQHWLRVSEVFLTRSDGNRAREIQFISQVFPFSIQIVLLIVTLWATRRCSIRDYTSPLKKQTTSIYISLFPFIWIRFRNRWRTHIYTETHLHSIRIFLKSFPTVRDSS